VTTAVGTNLESAACFLSAYSEKRYALDFKPRQRLAQGTDIRAIMNGGEDQEKALKAISDAFIAAISAALDTLAGVVLASWSKGQPNKG